MTNKNKALIKEISNKLNKHIDKIHSIKEDKDMFTKEEIIDDYAFLYEYLSSLQAKLILEYLD